MCLGVQEAERLHQLRHAHVVGLYGVALSGSRGVLLMEYCSGTPSSLAPGTSGCQRSGHACTFSHQLVISLPAGWWLWQEAKAW